MPEESPNQTGVQEPPLPGVYFDRASREIHVWRHPNVNLRDIPPSTLLALGYDLLRLEKPQA